MKIGQFSDSFLPIVDGVGRVAYYYCDTLAKRGHECSAIVPLTKMGYRGQFPFEIIDYYCASLPKLPQYKAGMPMFDAHYHQHLSMTDFDLVHVHTPFIAGLQGVSYAKKHHIPLVGTFHSKYYDDFLQLTGWEALAELGTKGVVDFFEECDEVWAVSESSADTLKEYGYSKEVYVVPNGMDLRKISPELGDEVKKHFHLSDDPILLFVGQMNWKKNILRTLEACARLKQDAVKFQLVLAGQGPHVKEIEKKIEELDITDRTVYTGHLNDEKLLDGLYCSASLFVFPSIYDNAPMVVREAANAATASVVVGTSSAAEVITDKVNGLYCEDTTESLYQVLKENLKNPAHLKAMGEHAQKSIPIAWDTVMEQVEERYQNLIELYQKNR